MSKVPAGTVTTEHATAGGALSAETRARLALEAFRRTSQYDAAIAAYLGSGAPDFPERISIVAERLQHLRYGENPHQAAAFYRAAGPAVGLAAAEQLHGPELSYNNLLDWSAALGLLVGLGQLIEPGYLDVAKRLAEAAKNWTNERLFYTHGFGITAVPVNAKLHSSELGFILEHSGARAVVFSAKTSEAVEAALRTRRSFPPAGGSSYCTCKAAGCTVTAVERVVVPPRPTAVNASIARCVSDYARRAI